MQSPELPCSAARWIRLILSGILPAGVLALVGACATITSTTEELPELVLKDDVIELRERGDEAPPNSPGKPRLFILALDGMNRGLLYDMLRGGELPEFAALLGGRSNGAFKHAHFDDRLTATLPSSTAPGWATAMTGAPPAEHGIAGYVADRSTCPEAGTTCSWRQPPRYQDDVLALAEAIWRNNKSGHLVPELKEALDMVLTRQPRPAAEDDLPFEVYVGDGRTVPVGDYLVDHPRPDYVSLEARLRDLAVGRYGDRAGDILLIPRNGSGQAVDNRYYFGAPYSSWHGGPARDDSELPLIVAHPDYDSGTLRETVERVLGERGAQQRFTDLLLELRYGDAPGRRPSEE